MKFRISYIIYMLAAAILATSCTHGTEKAPLVVSVDPQRSILQEIVGDRHEVISLLVTGTNPETFEPTVTTRMAVERTPAFFTTGVLPFEQALIEKMGTKNAYDTSKGLELIYGTHGHSHHMHSDMHGDLPDPHVWVSVRNARRVAANMVEQMVRLEPENASFYTENYKRLDARLDSLDRVISERLAALPADRRAFAVWHPSLSYFARDYGLEQIAVGFENKETSPVRIAAVAEEAREHGVKVFFYQTGTDSRHASTLNKAIGSELIEMNAMAPDWEQQLENVTDALTR